MLSPPQLLRLARAYGEAEGLQLSTIGKRAAGNNKCLRRLAAGQGITVATVIALETFFRGHWPDGAVWPADIPNAPGKPARRRRDCAA